MKRSTKRNAQAGITMLEVMVAVAVVGILIKLALPSLAGSSRKVKGDTEVNAFITELRMKQEQFHLENGRYLSTGASETAMFPATAQPQQVAITTLPAEWNQLRVNLPEAQARCQYVAIAGNKLSGTIGSVAASFGFSNPGRDWYYLLAHCDLDGDTATDSWYFTSSQDAAIQKLNPGR